MIATWYAVVSFMLIIYIVLDGRNFGAGMLHWFVARTPEERRQVIAAIGPLWSWHEVWLVGFGGMLVAIFPRLMASAFAGYYLALFLILWCLILRGISIEVGGHINDRLWQTYWDFIFVGSNFLLAILFGAAAGNVARGVPLNADGNFSMAFYGLQRPRPCRPARLVHCIDRDSCCRNPGSSWRDVSHAQDRRPSPRPQRKTREVSLDRGCPAARRSSDRIENRASGSARTRLIQSVLVDRIGRRRYLDDHADLWPSHSARIACLRGIKFSHRRTVGHRSGRNFSGDASFDSGPRELANRVCCGVESRNFTSSELLVADRFRPRGVLFRLHLATLCRKSERSARHSRLLLEVLNNNIVKVTS